ncbi:hypothetical protein [Pseudoclavibacter helvolus]|uniref:Galactosyl transferase GMA12/MNN10 family protein n=1 Tax=Pseudoclavibacter helvolus TaxID=255205 RepID=A0A7W4UPZ1_9MICO|nr:hypothetical protein [Pseudoclavibacter helvolus]MBB2958494.1 hypothetical protein [Pseudoclavibacter helvolus]
MNTLDICIVSGADFVALHSYVNHSVYAREFGYDFRFEAGVAEAVENVFFFKTAAIERVIERYDWVVWMDDDTFVTDFSRDRIRDLIDGAEATGVSFVVASGPEEPNGFFSMLNSGVMLLKNCPENVEMLGNMNDESLARARAWWDDDKFGVFTGGDQDIIIWMLHDRDWLPRTKIVNHRELNSRTHHYENSLDDAFICHFCGHWDKALSIAQFAERFHTNQALVPSELAVKYSIKRLNPQSRATVRLRGGVARLAARAKHLLRPVLELSERSGRRSGLRIAAHRLRAALR